MEIITISRGSFSHGKEIAERVAEILGYECISREILLEASRFFHISERKLLKSLRDAPSFLDKITHGRGREQYIAYIKAALLEHVKKDGVVYHGHAGHLLIPEVAHALKVRIIADMDARVALLMQKENMSSADALAFIKDSDRNRAEWTRYLYKVDIEDPRLYDIIINIGGMKIEDVCTIICSTVRCEPFKTTPETKRALGDLALQSHISAALQPICKAEVISRDGFVHIKVPAQKLTETGYSSPQTRSQVHETIQIDLIKEITEIVNTIPGVKDVVCDVEKPYSS
ncbi:AAA family ATPase [Thermodesulfobacteriota bacterium]